MRNLKSLLFICLIAGLFSCKKSIDPAFQNDPEEKSIKQLPSKDPSAILNAGTTDANARTYTNFVNLTQLSNGDYTDGHIWFDQIIYQTGDYLDGVPAASINYYFDPAVTTNVLWSDSEGPFFIYVQGTAMGGSYLPSFMNEWDTFRVKFRDFLDDTPDSAGSVYPNPEDYLPEIGGNGELVTKGFVVRRHSSSSTFAIAPSTFKPVIPIAGVNFFIGYIEESGYRFEIGCLTGPNYYMPNTGPITNINAFDLSNNSPITLNGFVGTYTKKPNGSFTVVAEATLLNGSIISFSGSLTDFGD